MAAIEGIEFAGFELLRKLGEGGMGFVYQARQVATGKLVALKFLSNELALNQDYIASFLREASLASSIHHPNIIPIYASGECEGLHFIAMQFEANGTLHDRLKATGPLPPHEALSVCFPIVRALHYVWRRLRLIHRDVKPSNIYFSATGAVKLGDLGIARSIDGTERDPTPLGTTMGTPHYMSPEQAQGWSNLDFRTDIYSLGCTLYHMLTGITPYDGNSTEIAVRQVYDPPPKVYDKLPNCPPPLASLLGKMLAKNRDDRHRDYKELRLELMAVAKSLDGISWIPPLHAEMVQTPTTRISVEI